MLFIFPVIVFISILMSISLILQVEISGKNSMFAILESQNKSHDLKRFESIFADTNKESLDINNLQNKHLHWSNVLTLLAEIVPKDVYFSDISTKNWQIFLVGKAREREALIGFQEMISKSECFEKVNVPLSNFVSKSDIEFQMDFFVKKECLVKE